MRTTTATVDRAVYHTHRHAPVNLAGMDHHDQEKSREQNLNLLSSKPETEVTNDRRRIVLLKEDTRSIAWPLQQQGYLLVTITKTKKNYNQKILTAKT